MSTRTRTLDGHVPCKWCNDEGIVHTHDGEIIGPCDCARNDGDLESQAYERGRRAGRVTLKSDLSERLHRAVERLGERESDPSLGMMEAARLRGKIEGVKLALSYLNDPPEIDGDR